MLMSLFPWSAKHSVHVLEQNHRPEDSSQVVSLLSDASHAKYSISCCGTVGHG